MEAKKEKEASPKKEKEVSPKKGMTAAETGEKNQRLAEVAKLLAENQGKISLGQYETVLHHLFEIIPELETIQKNARLRVCNQLFVKSLAPGEKFVSEEDELKDFYVVTEGTLLHASVGEKINIKKEVKAFNAEKLKSAHKEQEAKTETPEESPEKHPQEAKKAASKGKKLLTPGVMFGELTFIMQKKWRHANIYALEESSLISFSNYQINRITKELSSKQEFQELLTFLTEIFPDFSSTSNSQQRKIIDCFKPMEFLPGQYLIREGETGSMAYLIKQGECIFQSTRNPLLEFSASLKGKKPMDVALRTKRGFLSSTTSTFQFGILERNQWAGEERLLKEVDEPAGYSIMARTNVRAFSITKEDAKKKFTKELTQFVVSLVEQRYLWLKDRAKHLAQASVNVANMDPSDIKYDDNLAELTKKFPIATSYVLTNIRKKSIMAKSLSTARTMTSLALNDIPPQYQTLTKTFNATARVPSVDASMGNTMALTRRDTTFPSIFSSPRTYLHSSAEELKISVLSARKSVAMNMASSASHLIRQTSYAPVFSQQKPKPKSRVPSSESVSRRGRSVDEEKLNIKFKDELNRRNLNKFMVGKRTIKLVDTIYGKRPTTPNPFALLAAPKAPHIPLPVAAVPLNIPS